jgi:hypothetical protein
MTLAEHRVIEAAKALVANWKFSERQPFGLAGELWEAVKALERKEVELVVSETESR